MHAANGHLHSWEDMPAMIRLYFKIPNLDMVRIENFKVRYRQSHITVAISWPQHLKQTLDVGPFSDLVDPKSIVVSRKGEQVVVSIAKITKQKWDALTKTSGGYKDIRIDFLHRHSQSSASKESKDGLTLVPDSARKLEGSKGKLLSDFNTTGKLGKLKPSNSNFPQRDNAVAKFSSPKQEIDDQSSYEGIEVEKRDSSSTILQ